MTSSLAPVVLFTYNRPSHTSQALHSLMNNDLAGETELIIYCDGPKEGIREEELNKIEEVRKIVREKKWCGDVKIIESKTNKGLANSIVSGVSEVLNKYGKIIVLEDDMLTSTCFLKFMNDALNLYENDEEVVCINGYIYPVKKQLPETFFIRGADCWGWATWKRGWNCFETDGKKLLSALEEKNLTAAFDFNSSYPFTRMLIDQIAGKNDSWAIRWYASAFLKNKLTLYPAESFVRNIGNDKSGFHGMNSDEFNVKLSDTPFSGKKTVCVENTEAKKIIEDYFRSLFKKKNFLTLIFNKLVPLLKK
jgi:hypothetical protein